MLPWLPSVSYLLHLWVCLDEASHDLGVGHEALGKRAVHYLPQHVRVTKHLISEKMR